MSGPRAVIIAVLIIMAQGCASGYQNGGLNHRYNRLLREAAIETSVTTRASSRQEHKEDPLKGVDALGMETAVETALADNPDLGSMRQRTREAAEKYPQAVSLDDPSVGVGFYPATVGSDDPDFSYKVYLSQRLPLAWEARSQG